MVNQEERDTVLFLFHSGQRYTSSEVADALNITVGKSKYYLNKLASEGLLRSLGRGKTGGYILSKTARRNGVETDSNILDLLRDQGPLTSGQLADALNMTRSAVAQRLHRLKTADKVVGERSGANRGYRLAEITGKFSTQLQPETSSISDDTKASREELVETVNILSDTETMSAITQAETASLSDETKALFVEWMDRPPYVATTSDASTVDGIAVTGPSGNNLVSVEADMFDRVKNLPFAVGVAAVALLNNDVQTAKRLLEFA